MSAILNGQVRERIIRNCDTGWQGQYQQPGEDVRVWQKLDPGRVADLVFDAKCRQVAGAIALFAEMSNKKWSIRSTAKPGGIGDERGVDNELHATVRAGSRSYHLQCKEKPQLHVFRVTS